jgi:rhodanese-related sulfurtransferase
MMTKDQARPLIWLPALVALAVILAGCGPGGNADPAPANGGKNADGYTDISVEELASLLESEDVTMVNVHIPYEGEIPETDLFVPYNQIDALQAALPDKDAPIVLYCRTGSMSTSAARALARDGDSNIMELDGGFIAWRAAGHELLNR